VRLRRGAYLLPSLFTIGNMILGFYAVVTAFRASRLLDVAAGDRLFVWAAAAVFAAAILDTFDGRIARMTGTDSEFGREYDSLADLFTFGAVPALLTFLWGLHDFGRVGWLVPVYYMVCTATRLARFNVQTKVTDSRYFVGLPSPAAAGVVCSLLFYVPEAGPWREGWAGVIFATLALAGTLEVTTFRYWSTKQVDFRKRWSYRAALPLALIVLIITWEPKAFFLVMGVTYALSGPFNWLIGRLRRRGGASLEPERPEAETADDTHPGTRPTGDPT
jgi:CDP-diacylglycerol--serine O-phosphatidyltransferase